MTELEGKVAFITGASRGIGSAVARVLDAEGVEGRGRTPEMPELTGMMRPEDVAAVVLFVITRPRNHRILETAFRPMTETSWG